MNRDVLEFDLAAPDLFPRNHYLGTRSGQEERGDRNHWHISLTKAGEGLLPFVEWNGYVFSPNRKAHRVLFLNYIISNRNPKQIRTFVFLLLPFVSWWNFFILIFFLKVFVFINPQNFSKISLLLQKILPIEANLFTPSFHRTKDDQMLILILSFFAEQNLCFQKLTHKTNNINSFILLPRFLLLSSIWGNVSHRKVNI